MDLRSYNKLVTNVFTLYALDEDSGTFALAYALLRSPTFLKCFLKNLGIENYNADEILIDVQKSREQKKSNACSGFTDLEIKSNKEEFHLIIEAKKGWKFPGKEQLDKYAERFAPSVKKKIILSLSAVSEEYAKIYFSYHPEDSIRAEHRSWHTMQKIASRAKDNASSNKEKLWLKELDDHLRRYVSMQDQTDNNVYVVSLARAKISPDHDYTWIDVVTKDGRYFHPMGKGWPHIPPNYIGFRWWGELQSVHKIEEHKVVRDLQEENPKWPKKDTEFFVYTLGPPMKPQGTVKTGALFRSGRCWCAIDTLLSGKYDTISDARDETQRRWAAED